MVTKGRITDLFWFSSTRIRRECRPQKDQNHAESKYFESPHCGQHIP
jgi:hypothetical protein